MANTTLTGTEFDDTLSDLLTSPGDDLFLGLDANDLLVSTQGRDTINGGDGFDTADFSDRSGSVNVNLVNGVEANSLSALVSIEAAIGSAFDDVISGNDAANLLEGGAGDDVIGGEDGDDTLAGGAGDDDLDGGDGFDIASYADASAGVVVNLAAGTATGEGSDLLSNIEGVVGSGFDDSLVGSAVANLLNVGTGGMDTVVGGAGFDTISFADASGSVNINLATGTEANTLTTFSGIEAAIGSAFDDAISGDDAANLLEGGAGDDVIGGEDGDDTLAGGAGDDDLDGGDGFDIASYADASAGVVVNLAAGTATGEGSDLLSNIEGVVGSGFDDSLVGSAVANLLNVGTGGMDTVVGGAGFDTISFADASGSVNINLATGTEANTLTTFSGIEAAIGSAFDDAISGDDAANLLEGGAGDDVIGGEDGDDTLAGGAGDDDLDGGDGFDIASYADASAGVVVNLAAGTATGEGSDLLSNIEGVVGSGFDDSLVGSAVANLLNVGTGGMDTVVGGAGFDTISFADASGSVNINLATGTEANTLTTFSGIEAAIGSAFDDAISGDDAANLLEGGAGDDVIGGEDGDDTLAGGAGDDDLDGGDGFDIASYADASAGVVVNLAAGTATGEGSDLLSNIEGVVGSGFDDSLVGSAVANLLNVGTGGMDTVVGGAGFDTISFADASGSVNINLATGTEANTLTTFSGIEAAIGSAFDDAISGDDAANLLEGGAGDDVIGGEDGDDTLAGGAGDDDLDGGDGFDIASYADASAGVVVNLAAGTATGEGSDLLSNIEGVVGSGFDDSLVGSAVANLLNVGTGGMDTVVGGAGFDTISFADASGSVNINLATGTEANTLTTFSGIEAAIGSAFDDAISGDDAANLLEGGAGDDVIGGEDGDDTLAGGAGDDDLDGGDGFDIASYADASAGVVVNLAAGTATGEGSDLLSNIEGVVGSGFDDSLVGSAVANLLNVGTGGMDTVVGGAGFDTISFADASGSVNINLATGTEANTLTTFSGIEAAIGSAFDDAISGDAAANWLSGGEGDDVIAGGLGDDTLVGGAGDDDLDGGAGFDIASYANATNGVVVNLAAGTATGDGSDLLTSVEGVIGTAYDDSLVGTAAANFFNVGAGGLDTVVGGLGFDTISFANATTSVNIDLSSGTEANTLTTFTGIEAAVGSAFDDSILGDASANWLNGGAGDDVIVAGAGNDTVVGAAGDDDLDGGTGFDIASFASATAGVVVNLVTGTATGQGSDLLTDFEGVIGSAYDDSLVGTSDANLLNVGSGGRDSVVGGSGFDTISFASTTGSVNIDLATGTEANTLTTFSGIEAASGGAFDDSIIGDDDANWLAGAAGDDVVKGNAGNDTIVGGTGDDDLDGGTGFDIASYASATTGVVVNLAAGTATGQGSDVLADFEGVIGSAYGDSLVGTSDDNLLNVGSGGRDSVVGGAGFDTISFASASTSVNIDLATGTEANTLTTFSGIEAAAGGAFDDSITGDDVANWLGGGAGDDVIKGNDGNDTVAGGTGDDDLDGGDGSDIVSYASATNGVEVNLATGTATGQGSDILAGFEGVIGSAYADLLIGDAVANWLNGAVGADTLTGGGGADSFFFSAGQADGDLVTDFSGAVGDGDVLLFANYGDGATFTNIGGDQYEVASADRSIVDVITVTGTISSGDWDFI